MLVRNHNHNLSFNVSPYFSFPLFPYFLNTYKVLKENKLYVQLQLEIVQRAIIKKQTIRNPGIVIMQTKIFKRPYYECFGAVRDYIQ